MRNLNLDMAPPYHSTVGFDRLFEMLDQAARVEPMTDWPPYNIEKTGEDHCRITMAVAGFDADDIDLTEHETTLIAIVAVLLFSSPWLFGFAGEPATSWNP
jgi:HSP20 family molecular chaperone IbpA